MPMQKVIPDHVDFRLRLPRNIEEALRERAAAKWQDRNEYVRGLIRKDLEKYLQADKQ
jgi:hypothetical protein